MASRLILTQMRAATAAKRLRSKRFATHEPHAERLSVFVRHLCEWFATHEPLAARLLELVEALLEWHEALHERFAKYQTLAAQVRAKRG
jgi:hypothetical protein